MYFHNGRSAGIYANGRLQLMSATSYLKGLPPQPGCGELDFIPPCT